jgi:hypothetical protein
MNIMVKRFIHKKIKDNISSRRLTILKNPTVEKVENIVVEEKKQEIVEEKPIVVEPTIEVEEIVKNNEEIKEDNVMDTKEKIQMANAILNAEQPKVKKVKKEKGLIERTESSITILTEDNRELLKD